jgi:hypothetical protein
MRVPSPEYGNYGDQANCKGEEDGTGEGPGIVRGNVSQLKTRNWRTGRRTGKKQLETERDKASRFTLSFSSAERASG